MLTLLQKLFPLGQEMLSLSQINCSIMRIYLIGEQSSPPPHTHNTVLLGMLPRLKRKTFHPYSCMDRPTKIVYIASPHGQQCRLSTNTGRTEIHKGSSQVKYSRSLFLQRNDIGSLKHMDGGFSETRPTSWQCLQLCMSSLSPQLTTGLGTCLTFSPWQH